MSKNGTFPSEADIHAYVDGRLDEVSHRRMQAWMRIHPDRAECMRGWQRDAQELQAAFGDLPSEALGAVSLHAPRRRRSWRIAAVVVSLFLAGNIGGLAGWQLRGVSQESPAPMADAVQAYRLFVLDRGAPLDVTQTAAGTVHAWMNQYLPGAAPLPDLSPSGFHIVGARLLANTGGAAAMVVYQNGAGESVSFYARSPDPGARPIPRGARHEGSFAVDYWSSGGYNYALVGALPFNAFIHAKVAGRIMPAPPHDRTGHA